MRPLVAAAALGALLTASAPAAGTAPTLRAVTNAPPLTLAGRGFAPGERITIAIFAGNSRTATVVARRDGMFVVRLAVTPKMCLFWRATLVGSRSGGTTFHGPVADCRPEGGVSAAGGPPLRVGTGIAGAVRRGPIVPVCVAELPCDGPAPGVIVEVVAVRTTVARLLTGADGRFVVHVPPGMYLVRVVARRAASVAVEVRAGAFASVSLSIDTGIR